MLMFPSDFTYTPVSADANLTVSKCLSVWAKANYSYAHLLPTYQAVMK